MANQWAGPRVTKARTYIASTLPSRCPKCDKLVMPGDAFVVGHIKSRSGYPELMWNVDNWLAEHKQCSQKSAQSVVIENAKRQALAEHGITFSPETDSRQSPLLFAHTHSPSEPLEIPERLTWANACQSAPAWLQPYLAVPGDASPPLAISPVHPDAVGSYGPQAIEWVKTELGIELRWWQRLAFVKQLEHRADGSLCWRTILESCPRRAGKSVRLRAMALWRLDSSALFGETQLALHTGKDVAIVREIHRQAWRWASERDLWAVRKGVGQEEVYLGDNRWLVRSMDSVYGYDVTLAMVDESWAVDPATFEEGLEPATLERLSPQALLTSTAHRKATKLMPGKLSAALSTDDGETLLLLWAAHPQADPGDPETWRSASPHWSESRSRMIAAKWEAAQAGEADPEFGDLDPQVSFQNQYLNIWELNPRKQIRGDALVTPEAFAALVGDKPTRRPDACAVESWFAEGVSLARAWRLPDGRALVQVTDHPDLAAAVDALRATDYRGSTTVGASLMDDPALRGVRATKGTGRTAQAVTDMEHLLSERGLLHEGSEHLATQVTNVRTQAAPDGVRVVSKGRADAIKAATWAAATARQRRSGGPLVVLPRGV